MAVELAASDEAVKVLAEMVRRHRERIESEREAS